MTAVEIDKQLRLVEGAPARDRKAHAFRVAIGAGHQKELIGEGQHRVATLCGDLPSSQGDISAETPSPGRGIFPTMSTTLPERIEQRLADLGTTATAVSLKISDNKDLLRDIINGRTRNPRADTMRKVALGLECTLEWLMEGDGAPTPPLLEGRPRSNARPADVDIPYRNTLIRDIEVRGTVAGSMAGAFQFEGGVVDYVARPPGLINAKGIYALYVEGVSMVPAHSPGELRFISAFKHPNIGDTVAVTAQYTPDGPIESFIKTLVKRTNSKIVVEQLNPRALIEFDMQYVVSVHKVLTVNELFGI